MEDEADDEGRRAYGAVVPVEDKDEDEADPEDDVAPTGADGGDGAIALVLYNVSGTTARDETDGAEDEEESEDQGVEVVMAGTGVDEKVRIEDPDGQDGEELRPEHPFLKGEARHGNFSVSKIFDMEDCTASMLRVSNIFDIGCYGKHEGGMSICNLVPRGRGGRFV